MWSLDLSLFSLLVGRILYLEYIDFQKQILVLGELCLGYFPVYEGSTL